MKKLIIFGSLSFVFVFIATAADTRISAQEPQMTGAYSDASIKDRDVRKAANFAVKQRAANTKKKLTLVSIRKAEIQVVAGLNYRICMRVTDARGRRSLITAIVYKNLKNRYELSTWRSGGCSEI